MGDDYDTDILTWSERQADLLRRVAGGERINHLVGWENVVAEIESVGRSELHAVVSLLVQALAHMLKAEAWPLARDVPSWLADARGFRGDAAARFAPSMRQRLDLARIYCRAIDRLPDTIDAQPPLPVPTDCPVTLDELLAKPSA